MTRSTLPYVNMTQDIALFHEKFNLEYEGPPRLLAQDLHAFRSNFMEEELAEYCKAYAEQDLEGQLDALVDLVYVALGTAYLHGFDFNEAWRRVQHANMQKVRAQTSSDSKRGSMHDVVKPKGWRPPDLSDLVKT